MEIVNVIVCRGNVVEKNYAFAGTNTVASGFAESKFREVAAKYGMTSDNFDEEDIEDMITEGVYETEDDFSVCISHANCED